MKVRFAQRSGLASKHGIAVLNAPGTIDSDYQGELQVLLFNHSKHVFEIAHGDRIAQLIIAPTAQAQIKEITDPNELGTTERNKAGFGSTGV